MNFESPRSSIIKIADLTRSHVEHISPKHRKQRDQFDQLQEEMFPNWQRKAERDPIPGIGISNLTYSDHDSNSPNLLFTLNNKSTEMFEHQFEDLLTRTQTTDLQVKDVLSLFRIQNHMLNQKIEQSVASQKSEIGEL